MTALVLSLAALTGGCGSSDSGGTNSSNTLAKIKSDGVIRVGIAIDPPFAFKSNGKWTSFNPSLIEQYAKDIGVKVDFVASGWTGIVAGLQANKYDIIGASINATPDRKKVIDFTRPYYKTGTSFFVGSDNSSRLSTLDSMNSKDVTVAVVTGSDNEEAVHKYLPDATVRALPNASIADLISEVESGRSDALATSTYLAKALIAKYNYSMVPSESDSPNGTLPVGIAWGLPKNEPELLASLNTFLKKAESAGTIAGLEDQWFTVGNALK